MKSISTKNIPIELKNILNDKTSGSSELVLQINKFFKRNADDIGLIKNSLNKIKSKMKTFQVVMSYLKSLDKILASADMKRLKMFLNDFEAQSRNAYLRIYENLTPFIRSKKCIFTLSNSQTVFEVIKLWFNENNNLQVIIGESRPKFEGRILAKKLLKCEINIQIIPDCNYAEYISNCDLLLLGADKILINKNVINKTGSKDASIIAKYYRKPVYVLAFENKLSDQKKYKSAINSPEEIWRYKHPNLKIVNQYFEIVPKKLITKIITENTVL